MTGFLLDTNVLSEFSRSTVPPDQNVKRWMETAHPDMPFTSVLCIGEIRKGIELLVPSKKRNELERWIDGDLNGWFGNNLLPVTKAIANRWGILAARFAATGENLGQYRRAARRDRPGTWSDCRYAKHPAFREYGRCPLRSMARPGLSLVF